MVLRTCNRVTTSTSTPGLGRPSRSRTRWARLATSHTPARGRAPSPVGSRRPRRSIRDGIGLESMVIGERIARTQMRRAARNLRRDPQLRPGARRRASIGGLPPRPPPRPDWPELDDPSSPSASTLAACAWDRGRTRAHRRNGRLRGRDSQHSERARHQCPSTRRLGAHAEFARTGIGWVSAANPFCSGAPTSW